MRQFDRRLRVLGFERPRHPALAITLQGLGESREQAIERTRREAGELDLSGRVVFFREASRPLTAILEER